MRWLRFFIVIKLFFWCSTGAFAADRSVDKRHARFSEMPFVSIGFASENLDSVTSSFGHTFLIFHSSPFPEAQAIVYEFYGHLETSYDLVRSLTGLPGSFRFNDLQNKMREYDWENRDLWIFKLRMSQGERGHLNKVVLDQVSQNFTYYFLTKNCSWYIYETLMQSFELNDCHRQIYTPPINTVDWLNQCQRVEKVFFIDSSASLSERLYLSLDPAEKKKLQQINFYEKPQVEDLSSGARQYLSTYLNYKIPRTRHSFIRDKMLAWKIQAAEEVGLYPSSYQEKEFVAPKNTSLYFGYSPLNQNFLLGFSPGLISFENLPGNQFWSDKLEVLSLDFSFNTKNFVLHRLTVFDLRAKQSRTQFKRGFVRALKFGYDRFQLKNGPLEQGVLEIGGGKSWSPLHTLKASGIFGLEAGHYKRGSQQEMDLSPFLRAELDVKAFDHLRANLAYTYFSHLNKVKTSKLDIKLSLIKRSDILLSLQSTLIDHKERELFLRFNYLFN